MRKTLQIVKEQAKRFGSKSLYKIAMILMFPSYRYGQLYLDEEDISELVELVAQLSQEMTDLQKQVTHLSS